MSFTVTTVLSILMFTASALAFLVILYAGRSRTASGGREFILLNLAVAVYAFFAALEMAATTISVKVLWSKLSYLGVVSLAPCWLMFAWSYYHPKNRINLRRLVALWVVPLITLGFVFTNEWHGLIWSSLTFASAEPGAMLIYGHGFVFWVHAAYAYLLMAAGTYWLIRSAWHSQHLFQWHVALVVIVGLILWGGNLLYILPSGSWRGAYLMPIALLLSELLLAVSLYLFQTFDLLPVAREIVFNNIGAGVVVLDNLNRLVEINPLAKQWTGLRDEAVGHNLFEVLQLGETLRQYEHASEAQTVIEIGAAENRHIFNLTISPILDGRGFLQGRVVLFHDISVEHSLRESERRYARRMELLNSITLVALGYTEFPNVFQMLADRLGELFEADAAYLTLWDEDRQRVIPAAAHGEMRERFSEIIFQPGKKTLTESVLAAGHVLVAEDAFNTPYLSAEIAALFPTRSCLVLPLISNNKKLGAAIVSFDQSHHFDDEEIALGEQAAGQISLAIDKVSMYATERERNTQLVALQLVSHAVASSLQLDIVLNRIAGYAKDLLNAISVAVYLYDPTQQLLIANTALGVDAEEIMQDPVSLGEGILGTIALQKTGEIVNDTSTDARAITIKGTVDVDDEHILVVPILNREQLTGLIAAWRIGAMEKFKSSDLDFLNSLALQAAIAIENARLYAEAEHTAIMDELTGIYNRRGLFELGKQELERAIRFKHSLVALFLDIDHFKNFNDTYSYAVGDQVLRLFADCLRSNLRGFDVIGRYGGEEFVVLLPETGLIGAREVAERIRAAVESLKVTTSLGETSCTVSIGVCAMTSQMPELYTLIDRAGEAVHLAKLNGRNRVEWL